MANAPQNQKGDNQEDDKEKTAGEDEDAKRYIQPLFEELNKLTDQDSPKYTTVMAWAVCVGLLTLVALPLGSLWISSNYFCCFDNDSLQNQLTFWAAMLGGFLALFGIVISGLFVVFALRIDYGAKLEASRHAVKAAIEFIKIDHKKLLTDFAKKTEDFLSSVAKKQKDINDAKAAIDGSIASFWSNKKKWDEKAEEIEQALPDIKEKLDQANQEADAKNRQLVEIQEMVEAMIAELKERSNSAMQDIEALVANVQKAADEATRKLQSETPGDGQEPRS